MIDWILRVATSPDTWPAVAVTATSSTSGSNNASTIANASPIPGSASMTSFCATVR